MSTAEIFYQVCWVLVLLWFIPLVKHKACISKSVKTYSVLPDTSDPVKTRTIRGLKYTFRVQGRQFCQNCFYSLRGENLFLLEQTPLQNGLGVQKADRKSQQLFPL